MKARQQKVFQIERFEKVVNILIVEHLLLKMWVTITILRKSNLLIACIIQLLRTNISNRSSYKERKGNALASGADEGRDKLR